MPHNGASAPTLERSLGYRPTRSIRAGRSKLKRPLALILGPLLASILMLAGCGGPASTIFNSAAPTESIVPYITGGNYAGAASVVGLRGKDGTEVWRTVIGQRDNDAATAVVGGVLYIEAGPPATPSPQLPSGAVLAIRLSDGKMLWRTPLPRSDSRVGIAADETTVVAAAGVGGLYALDASTGAIRWHQVASLSQDVDDSPHLSDGVVLASQSGAPASDSTIAAGLSAWRESDGRLLWQQSYGAAIATNQFAAYFTLSDDTFALSPSSGHQIWYYQSGRTVEGGGADNYHGQVIAVGEQFVLAQETYPVVSYDLPTKDYLASLDARTGQVNWKSSPGLDGALSFGSLVIATASGATTIYGAHKTALVALRGTDGTQLWTADLAPYTAQQLAHVDGVVVALVYPPACELSCWSQPTSMRMEALDGATGAIYWQRDVPDALALQGAG